MPADEDITLHEKIGYMRAGISGVTDKVNRVLKKVEDVDDKISTLSESTVKHEQCDGRTAKIEKKIDSIIYELGKKQTRQTNPVVGRSAENTERFHIDDLTHTPSAQVPPHKPFLARLKDNALAITAVLSLLTIAGVGFLNLARFVVRVENVLEENKALTEKQTKKLKAEIKRIDEAKPRIIYVPAKPDAGAPPRRRRRTRARPSRVQPARKPANAGSR